MLDTILFVLYGVLVLVFGLAVRQLAFAIRHFRMTRLFTVPSVIEEKPGVTVCIPARNEVHAMTECLERVVASNYPKLEVIVLDDMSADDTSILIKSFAHAGVRFIEGSPLPDGWLGKNHALQGLLKQASGTYVLFMDVDTRVQPDTIEQLVAYIEQEKAAMISVMPRREDGWRPSVIFSPLRYFWEIAFHRRVAPATASNAWMIRRQVLLDRWGSFEPFKAAIQPESRFSAELMKTNEYRFLLGTEMMGLSYEKKWRSQVATSIRLLYPLLGANVANVIVAVVDLLIGVSPIAILLAGFIAGWGWHQLAAGVIYGLFAILYATYLRQVWRRGWIIAALLWPFTVMQEIVLIILSAERYLRRAVTWKGRLVKSPKL